MSEYKSKYTILHFENIKCIYVYTTHIYNRVVCIQFAKKREKKIEGNGAAAVGVHSLFSPKVNVTLYTTKTITRIYKSNK